MRTEDMSDVTVSYF